MRRWLAATVVVPALMLAAPVAADPLDGITIAPEVDAPYDRESMYGSWRDDDGDCQNTRQEVLAAESLIPVVLSDDGYNVRTGLWFDPYTGLTFTVPGDLDIDHLVPLKEAHQSGAHAWTNEKRRDYANDLDNPGLLIAVDDGTNQSKGDKDPAEWLPPSLAFRCAYVSAWIAVKRKWNLAMDSVEAAAIRDGFSECPSRMPIFTVDIAERPTVVVAARDYAGALVFVADGFTRSELQMITTVDGAPLWDGVSKITVRLATEPEIQVWEKGVIDALEGQVYEDREDAIAGGCFSFLVPYLD